MYINELPELVEKYGLDEDALSRTKDEWEKSLQSKSYSDVKIELSKVSVLLSNRNGYFENESIELRYNILDIDHFPLASCFIYYNLDGSYKSIRIKE